MSSVSLDSLLGSLPASRASARPAARQRPALTDAWRASFAVWLVLALAACATPDPNTPAGEIVQSAATPSAGAVFTYSTFNAYNNEPRATVRQTFSPAGSKVEGMDYEGPSEGGFYIARPITVNRVLDAAGNLVRLERVDGTSVTYDPPLKVLPFPLRPGVRFKQTLTARESDGSAPRKVIVSGYVAGWETVRVPAGEYRALRIVRDSWLGDHQTGRSETMRSETDWYAPSVGTVVRSEENSLFEDHLMGRGDDSRAFIRYGDWLRWELKSVGRVGAAAS